MKKRYELALIVSDVTISFSHEICRGAMKAAEEYDVNLTLFPAKYIGNANYKSVDALYEYQYNSLLSYAAMGKFDYIIAGIGCIIINDINGLSNRISNMFGDTPVISICSNVKDAINVQFDNYTGIIEAIDFLVNDGRKNICMLTGNPHNHECRLRFNAYKDGMASHNMDVLDSMHLDCSLSGECEDEVAELLKRNPDMDALICVNDVVAATVYKVLQRQGIVIGKEIAVVGYDDMPTSAKMNPPLASTSADSYLLGYHAVKLAIADLNKEPLESCMLKTKFIPRMSCMRNIGTVLDIEQLIQKSSLEITEAILKYIFYSQTSISDNHKMFWFTLVEFLKSIYNDANPDLSQQRNIIKMIEDKLVLDDCNDETLLHIIDVFDSFVVWMTNHYPQHFNIVNTLRQTVSEKMLALLMDELSGEERRVLDSFHNTNLVTRQALMVGDNISESYASILSKMHCLDVSHSYLYLLDKPWAYKEYDFSVPNLKWKLKSYQHADKSYRCESKSQPVKAEDIFSNSYMPTKERHTHIVVDLYSREYQYGMLLCQIDDIDFSTFLEFLVYQISASVRIIELLKKQESMFEELHAKNLALEKISKVDELTGLYNRRGFYDEVKELLSYGDKELIVCYSDMDGLKIVNDTYGHIEGDYSLKQIAQCLKDIFGNQAIIGRMGGDEFVAVIDKEYVRDIESIRRKKDSWMYTLNTNSSKPYSIDISMGFYQCICSNYYDLKVAIDKADDVLYTIKIEKKKAKLISSS